MLKIENKKAGMEKSNKNQKKRYKNMQKKILKRKILTFFNFNQFITHSDFVNI